MREETRSLRWRQAALQLEAALRTHAGQAPERLDAATLAGDYPTRDWIVAAWRLGIVFSDGVTRRIDVLAGAKFPHTPVRTALVDHPDALTWPHVEGDGVLCLLPNLAEWDPDDPSAVALNLLNRSVRLVEELLDGGIVERDFREEFVTYWAYKAHTHGAEPCSLIAPAPPSRTVAVWRGHGLEVVGEDSAAVAQWVRRRFGDKTVVKTDDAAFLWLEAPLLPAEYPETAADLHRLAARLSQDAQAVLEHAAGAEPDELLTLLGAEGRGGAAVIAVKIPNPGSRKVRPRAPDEPLSLGFRPGRTPQPTLVGRFFAPTLPVVRTGVKRADADWVHGRGQDARTRRLRAAMVVVIGCGSLGGPVACALAQAGVGWIVIVDPETLTWPNVGRHPLGAAAVGRNKAEALAERLQSDFPHLTIGSRPARLQDLIAHERDLLAGADLIIAATGNWVAESALNRWHLAHGRERPVLYGWTEAHACAGHAVAIGRRDGCLQCHIGRTGAPDLTVVEWPDGDGNPREEPACGAHYQPYGPVELAFITAMIAETGLDALLAPSEASFSRAFVAAPRRISALGGQLTEAWRSAFGERDDGARTIDRAWPVSDCAACGVTSAEAGLNLAEKVPGRPPPAAASDVDVSPAGRRTSHPTPTPA